MERLWNLTKDCCRYIYSIVRCELLLFWVEFSLFFFFGEGDYFLGSLGYRISRILPISKNLLDVVQNLLHMVQKGRHKSINNLDPEEKGAEDIVV